jgi:pilus assembly protein CpaF
MHEIFSFHKRGIGPDGRVVGTFQPSHIRPKFLERLRISGIFLPPAMFEQTLEVN